jgi:hypothetical protein
MTADMFLKIVRKYTRVKKLTCIGNIRIPKILKLSGTDVRIQTGQGVTVRYAAQGAV